MSNKHTGSSFEDHFNEQFDDPEMARALYDSATKDIEQWEKAFAKTKERWMTAAEQMLAEIDRLERLLMIERAENARLQAKIKRRGM